MSHVTTVRANIKSIEDLETAVTSEKVGMLFMRDQKKHRFYAGADSSCLHAIRLPDHREGDFEIGVVALADGTFDLAYDSYGTGRRLEERAGQGLQVLKQEISVAAAMRTAQQKLSAKGFHRVIREDLPAGTVRLRIRRR